MRFADVIGQEKVKDKLADLVLRNRLSHALLFLGKEGSGALPMALALAQYVTCEKINPGSEIPATGPTLFGEEVQTNGTEAGPDADSCGLCRSCVKAKGMVHPDIHYSYPVVTKKSGTPPLSTDYISEWREFIHMNPYGNVYDWLQFIGAENKQGNITANECNDIIHKLSLKSFESEYKVLIMWMPEFLGKEGNKLLKLIEEPPPATLFILVAENEAQLLPTIVSRCQLVKIPRLETSGIEKALISEKHTDPGKAGRIAAASEGNYREALLLLGDTEDDWEGLLREWLNAIIRTGPVSQAKWVEEISRLGREKQKQFLRYFNHLISESIRFAVMAEKAGLTEPGVDFAQRMNKMADINQQQAIIEELDRAIYYIERNANAKILFHALTIRLYHIIQDKIVFLAD